MDENLRANLLSRALQVRDETAIGRNTALRVGQLFYDIIEAIKDGAVDIDSLKQYFISKVDADTAQSVITFLQGILIGNGDYGINSVGDASLKGIFADWIQSRDFSSGDLGSGFAIYKNGDSSRMEIDELLVRKIATFLKLEIRELAYVAGNIILSGAASEISNVEPVYDDFNVLVGWKCYWTADDGKTSTTNTWLPGDQARCQTFNIKRNSNGSVTNEVGSMENPDLISNRYYWRLVIETGADYVLLSATDHDSSTDNANLNCIPHVGDKIVQMGYRLGFNATESDPDDELHKDRTSLIEISTNGEDAPSIKAFHGVVDYSLNASRRVFLISPKGVVFNSTYFQWSSGGVTFPQRVYVGDWYPGAHSNYFEEWTHDNCLWLCVNANGTSDEPSIDSPDWKLISGTPTADEMVIDTNGFSDIAWGETITATCRIMRGSIDRTSEVLAWRVTRDSGDATADNIWNAAHSSFAGTLQISYSSTCDDIRRTDGLSTVFTFYADLPGGLYATGTISF